LKLKRQYAKNVGRELKIHRKDKTIVIGRVKEANDIRIVIEMEVKEGKKKELIQSEIPFSEIEKAIVMVSFK